jgi:hypothetical protein
MNWSFRFVYATTNFKIVVLLCDFRVKIWVCDLRFGCATHSFIILNVMLKVEVCGFSFLGFRVLSCNLKF